MLGGDPPGSFQVHMGHELTDTWVTSGNMEPLDALFHEEGWSNVFPQGVLDIISYQGKPYSVPVNIHRANVLWYNKKVFTDNNLQPPTTFDEFFTVADALKAKGITPLALGDVEVWTAVQVMETTLLGSLGADGYNGLWTGETDWNGAEVTAALDTFKKMLVLRQQGSQLAVLGPSQRPGHQRRSGDDDHGRLAATATTRRRTSRTSAGRRRRGPPASTTRSPTRSACRRTIRTRTLSSAGCSVVGSKEGQEAFNPLKGSICARTDCDPQPVR